MSPSVPSPALAAVGELPFLRELVLLFAVGLALTYVCHRLRLVSIVGFLLTGVLIGPHTLGLVGDLELIRQAAEVGIILLLFTIGIEFNLERMARIRRILAVGGGLQVTLTVALAAGILALVGVDWSSAVYTGCLVALSSTAVVLRLLSDRGATETPEGQITLGILIFQDLAAVLMVTLVPILAGAGESVQGIVWPVVRAGGLIALVLLLARRVVPPLLDRVARARNQELFLLTVVVVCFGIAWVSSLGGVSVALGAFLAGLAVSESRFREHAVGEILPLKTVFEAVFFVSVGMLLDPGVLLHRPGLVAVGLVGMTILKLATTSASVAVLRYPPRIVAAAGLGLAQVGEFSLILAEAGRSAGLSPAGLGPAGDQLFLGVAVLSMLLTPFLGQLEEPLLGWLDRERDAGDDERGEERTLREHVIVGGYGLAGRQARRGLAALRIPHLVVELNPVTVAEAEARGVPIHFGDLTNRAVLKEAGIERARMVVVAINDQRAARRIAERCRAANPAVEVVVRAQYLVEARALEEAGADVIVVEEAESAARVVHAVLRGCGVPREEADRQVARLREAGDQL